MEMEVSPDDLVSTETTMAKPNLLSMHTHTHTTHTDAYTPESTFELNRFCNTHHIQIDLLRNFILRDLHKHRSVGWSVGCYLAHNWELPFASMSNHMYKHTQKPCHHMQRPKEREKMDVR